MSTMTNIPTETQPEPQKRQMSNFTVRLLTAMALIPGAIIGMYIGGWLWALMAAPIAIIGALEFYSLARGRANEGIAWIGLLAVIAVLLGFQLEERVLWLMAPVVAAVAAFLVSFMHHRNLRVAFSQMLTTLVGIFYVGFPVGLLIATRHLENGFLWLVVICGLTWGTDTMAYAAGRLWGKHKLAPRLSPKKTVEGAAIGIFGGIIPAVLFLLRADKLSTTALIMVLIAPFVAIAGDLFESAIKRYYGVKDSHLAHFNIIPGHGGVLDRVDALLMVTVFCYLFITLTGIAS
jgi:phosphatidate cytidylyltransferase